MHSLLDLERYPLDRPDSREAAALVDVCRGQLAANGMFNLEEFVRPSAIARAEAELQPLAEQSSFTHQRTHNVYFRPDFPGLPADHPALTPLETTNHTVCGDQLSGTIVNRIYEWQPLVEFVARVIERPRLHLMKDPLARLNVMEYRAGEALNWHFDRSEYTTTLLLRPAAAGGEFEYRSGLRTDADPNYDGVARVLQGRDPAVAVNPLGAGTLNVFAGRNTLHRVSPVRGGQSRLIAVFCYYERPDVKFSDEESIGFYGRTA
jgi:hypothetical protein